MKAPGVKILEAGPRDEAELRALLRSQPMPGWVRISFEREPDYFAAAPIEGERHRVLLAREQTGPGDFGPLVGICARAVRRVFVDGEQRRLGYIGQFRAIDRWQGGWRVYGLLKKGFNEVERSLHRPDELPYDITSILSDNLAARRLLSANLRGMPHYQWLSGLNTLVYRCGGRVRKRDIKVESGTVAGLRAIADCLQRNYRRYQFAPVWDQAALNAAGQTPEDFLVLRDGARVTACLGIWDQRAAKQMVVRDYRKSIALLRPLINLATPLFGFPRLPRKGRPLQQGWMSHLACDQDEPAALEALLPAALSRGRQLGLEQLMLGLADAHPLLPVARGIRRHLHYRSDIYLIHWNESTIRVAPRDDWLALRQLLLEPATL
jgi:hypothetical protein